MSVRSYFLGFFFDTAGIDLILFAYAGIDKGVNASKKEVKNSVSDSSTEPCLPASANNHFLSNRENQGWTKLYTSA